MKNSFEPMASERSLGTGKPSETERGRLGMGTWNGRRVL